ncbi:MAG: translation initiation factor IF-2 [Chitinophagales bacterium]|nr:translation initiation factor IF-2 [Chitinophagales bacterium]
MAEVTTQEIRIQAVAKELNVSYTHLIETLQKKGFKVDNKPTIKISREMHEVLLKEYQQDLVDKKQAEKIALGSKLFKSAEEAAREKEVVIQPKKKAEPEPEIITAKETPAKEAAKEKPAVEKKEEKKEEKVEPKIEAKKEEKAEPVKKARAKVELEGPKVVGTVEIEKIEGKGKAEKKKTTKGKKEKAEEPVEQIAEVAAKAVIPAPEEPVKEVVEEEKTEAPPIEVKKTEYGKLEGTKVVGKIDLAKINVERPDYSKELKEKRDQLKRKRKRIYSSDKPESLQVPGKTETRPGTGDFRPGRTDRSRMAEGPTEVSEKQIQDKIRETMARLSGATKGKSAKSKYRRIKREEAEAEAELTAAAEGEKKTLMVTEFISAAELANLLNVPVTEVIKKCMDAGVIVSINQRLDAEIIELVASEFGSEVQFISVEQKDEMEVEEEEDDADSLKPRAPIVTIMGHVDHGKTSLLDFIRQSNVVAGEKGGITQHIGAYEVVLDNGKKITFLDTPGHEAFTAMRARGAKITDVAVIVIAADDAVMPQTKEAISHAQAAGVPMIFAFNKMDKPGASAERIRQQLAEMNILVEEWGGKFQTQEISAKAGVGVKDLLDKILLEAEYLDLKANPDKLSVGTVIEATLDRGRGYVANLLVQHGTLNIGDIIVAGNHFGKIKAMYNERGQRVEHAGPSAPVQVLGLDGAPQAGEKFKEFEDEHEAKQVAYKRQQIVREQGIRTKKHITLDEIGRRLALGNFKELNVIVKADFDGSVEALTDSMLKLSNPEIQVNIVHKAVGQITEGDVLLASASDAIIVGFQVRPSVSARKLAEKENIEIRLYSIIYDAIEELKSAMEGMLEPKIEEKITGNADVREVFNITKVGKVAGCFMTEGKIVRSNKVRLIRDGIVIYTGELSALKRFKDDVKEVVSGQECGISIKNFNDIKVGDMIEGFEETEVKRTL